MWLKFGMSLEQTFKRVMHSTSRGQFVRKLSEQIVLVHNLLFVINNTLWLKQFALRLQIWLRLQNEKPNNYSLIKLVNDLPLSCLSQPSSVDWISFTTGVKNILSWLLCQSDYVRQCFAFCWYKNCMCVRFYFQNNSNTGHTSNINIWTQSTNPGRHI